MNVRPLLTLLSDGEFHSGQSLGERLGISRAAVWKQVRRLAELGVEVDAVRGRGYRMAGRVRLLDAKRILALSGEAGSLFSGHFIVLFSTDSTNAEAMRRIQAGARHCVIMAEHQSGGRGRRGKSWVSPLGHNLYFSMVWPFQQGVAALEGLSLVCGLAVAAAVGRVSGQVSLKWPNDVLLDGRKLAGVLLEVQGDMEGACRVVVGVGVNTWMPVAAAGRIDQPFSMLGTADGEGCVDRDQLAADLVRELVWRLQRFERTGFGAFREEWMERDHYIGQPVSVGHGPDDGLTGIVAGVDDAGRLQLRLGNGRIRTLTGGEMFPSIRPVPGDADEFHDS